MVKRPLDRGHRQVPSTSPFVPSRGRRTGAYDPAMHIRFASVSLAVVLLAACGGGGAPGQTSNSNGATPPAATSGPGGGGSVDCAAMKTAGEQLLGIQLLAQMTTPDTVASIKAKEIGNLDPDKLLAALATLHALDSVSSPLGDPKAAIEVYEKAAEAAKVLFAKDTVTQADVDEYYKTVGTISEFLGHQVAISGALGEAGC